MSLRGKREPFSLQPASRNPAQWQPFGPCDETNTQGAAKQQTKESWATDVIEAQRQAGCLLHKRVILFLFELL